MKTSITIYSLNQYFQKGKMDVKSFIEYCGSLGIDGVDLGYYWKDEEKEVKLVPKWLREKNLTLAAYIVGNDFTKRKEEERANQISLVKHGIERASRLKTKVLRIFTGDINEDFPDYQKAKSVLVSCFKEVSSFAESKGIILALENHGKLCAKPEQIMDVLSKVDSPNLKLNLDVGNFMGVDEDPVSSVKRLAHLAVHTHIKDFKRKGREIIPVVLGEGDLDLRSCLNVLKDSGYKGYLSLEYEAEVDSKVGVERSLDNLKKFLN